MTNKLLYRPLFTLLTVAMLALPARAWADGRLHGVVLDQSGAVVPGAAVTISETTGGATRALITDERGHFEVDALPSGRYEVTASSPGFQSVAITASIGDGADRELALTLPVATQTASVSVTGRLAASPARVERERPRSNDAASLLDGLPGLSVAGNGGVSRIPAIHGLADDRVKLTINGMTLASACSTHMNPPLSYIDPANVGSMTVMAGITPVSAGGDSIGGSVAVESAKPEFASSGGAVHGSASVYGRSNGGTTGGNASFSAATEHLRFGYVGSYVDSNNYKAGGGDMVRSTFYTSSNHAVQMAMTHGARSLTADVSMQRIPEQGFANARMDMTRNDAALGSVRYEQTAAWGHLDARSYLERTSHEMNILRDKIPGMNMPMNTRGSNAGYTVSFDRRLGQRDVVKVGSELHRFALDDWWPPVMAMVGSMGPDTLQNINNGRRTRLGTFGEWEAHRGTWTTLVGLRSDVVSMNTGNVAGYNTSTTATGSAAYSADAAEFNARDHARTDRNVDATALARVAPTPTTSFELGYARKTRSPNLYERYLWVKRSNMAVQMNGWFGDANGYVGNLDLKPEVAHTVSATAGWHGAGDRDREVAFTPYLTYVNDFIDVDRCAAIAGSNGCTAAKLTATSGFVNLQFANHDSRLYGFDLSGRTPLGRSPRVGRVDVNGVVSYVRGRILDTGDNVYRLMPLDVRLTLDHRLNNWSNSVMLQGVAAKNRVQAVRNELATPGYTLVNVRTGYQFRAVRVDFGIDNLADTKYVLPLGGRYWIGDQTGATGVPGIGRSFYLGFTTSL
ncbi:MAG: TonB-dependent receptor [Vicinamibacterales bacterium]